MPTTSAMVILVGLVLPDFSLPNVMTRVGLWVGLYLLFSLGSCKITNNGVIAIEYFPPILIW